MDQPTPIPTPEQDPTWHVVVPLPASFKVKAQRLRAAGPSPQEAIARAEAAVAGMAADFDTWLDEAVATLQAARHGFDARPGDAQARADLFRAAHSVKGIAGTVGFPLVGRLADGLCTALERVPADVAIPTVLIDQHVDSIRAVVAEGARGDGSAIARTLVDRLGQITREFVDRATAA